MSNEINAQDGNITLIRKRIDALKQEVRETGDAEAGEKLVAAYRTLGILVTQELTRLAFCDQEELAAAPVALAVEDAA